VLGENGRMGGWKDGWINAEKEERKDVGWINTDKQH
jgi:hypothetical protein